MIVPIVYPSAAEFWLNHKDFSDEIFNNFSLEANNKAEADEVCSLNHDDCCDLPVGWDARINNSIADDVLRKLDLQGPLHVMSINDLKRNTAENCVCHVMPKHMPSKGFVHIGKITDDLDVYVSSPELTFLMAASRINLSPVKDKSDTWLAVNPNFLNLILLGTELCSMYMHDKSAKFEHRQCTPITRAEIIQNYLKSCERFYGIRTAEHAARYILNDSNSQMESKIAVYLTLPISLGGCGLPRPKLNAVIVLPKSAQKFYRHGTMRCDFVWENKKVIVEYDSNQTHMDARQHSTDSNRQNALVAAGYKVIRVTSELFKNFNDVDEVFMSLRKYLRMSNRHRMEESLSERRRTHAKIIASPIYRAFF